MKKALCIFLSALMLLGAVCTAAGAAGVPAFKDVKKGAWYYSAVSDCVSRGYLSGVGQDCFDPNGLMTRSMFACVLYRMAGSPKVTGDNPFRDVKKNKWYTDGILWAYQNDIFKGTAADRFGTEDPITREQIAAVLYRVSGDTLEYDVPAAFADAKAVSSFAKTGVGYAITIGILSGSVSGGKTYLNPRGNATRAEVSSMLIRAEEMLHGAFDLRRTAAARELSALRGEMLLFNTTVTLHEPMTDVLSAVPAVWHGKDVVTETEEDLWCETEFSEFCDACEVTVRMGDAEVCRLLFSYDSDEDGYCLFSAETPVGKRAVIPGCNLDVLENEDVSYLLGCEPTVNGTDTVWLFAGVFEGCGRFVTSFVRAQDGSFRFTRTTQSLSDLYDTSALAWDKGNFSVYGETLTLGKTTLADVMTLLGDRVWWAQYNLPQVYGTPNLSEGRAELAAKLPAELPENTKALPTFRFVSEKSDSEEYGDYVLSELYWGDIDAQTLVLPCGKVTSKLNKDKIAQSIGKDPDGEPRKVYRDPYLLIEHYTVDWTLPGDGNSFLLRFYYPTDTVGGSSYMVAPQ